MQNDPIYILKAIQHLRPNAECTIVEDDLHSINWIKLDGTKPTHQQILDAINVVKTNEQHAIADAEAKRQSAIDKLTALGLTPDEIAAL